MSFERLIKTLHSWLGVMILPWVVAMGFTGLYMNHDDLILSLFPTAHYDAALFDGAALARLTDETAAAQIATRLAPDEDLYLDATADFYHDRRVFTFEGESLDVMIDRATGFGWIDSRYLTQTFAPDGTQLHSRIRWSRVLSSIHERGWVGNAFGTWLADITACALVLFGLSGLILFAMPRLRRRRNRRARLDQGTPQQAAGR